MPSGRNKYQSRENRQRVRDVLMDHWDPIGVRGISTASDEYDRYVGEVYVMMMDARAAQGEINTYLFETATGHIGVSSSEWLVERCANTAAILVGLRPEFELH